VPKYAARPPESNQTLISMPELSCRDISQLLHQLGLFWPCFDLSCVVQRKLHNKSHSLTYLRLSEMGPSPSSFGDTYTLVFFEILEDLVEQEIAAQRACDNPQLNKLCYKMGTPAPICHPNPTSTMKLVSTSELKENDKECRLLLLRKWERVHDVFHVEDQESYALGQGGMRSMVGESAEQVVLPVGPTPALGLLSHMCSTSQMLTEVEEHCPSTRDAREQAIAPVYERNEGHDAHESCHGQEHLQDVERQGLSTKYVSNSQTARNTLPQVVQTSHIPIFQDQTRSTMRQNDPYRPLPPLADPPSN